MPITVNLNGQSGSYVGGTLLDIMRAHIQGDFV